MEVTKNDIIQAIEGTGIWQGCLLIVDEVKSWGVQAYMTIPNSAISSQGTAFMRFKTGEFEVVGHAYMVIEDSE